MKRVDSEAQLEKDEESYSALHHACQNWCYHLSLALPHEEAYDNIKSLAGAQWCLCASKIQKQVVEALDVQIGGIWLHKGH